MRGLPAARMVLGSWLVLGCAGTARAPAIPEEGLPLRVPGQLEVRGSAGEVAEDEPEPTPPAPGEATGPCPLRWTPRELHGSVFTLPAEVYGRMIAPLLRGVCACTRPGQSLVVVARYVPEHGEVAAQTADRPDQHARASASIDACLARELRVARFEPFQLGSDLVIPCDPPSSTARTAAQPLHLPAPRPAGCGPEERLSTIVVPLHVDRRDER